MASRPLAVGIDGGSGAGKTTLATYIQKKTDAALVNLDDFYTTEIPETDWPRYAFDERLKLIFDWKRVREDALIPLLDGRPGRWQAFDFLSGLRSDGTYGPQEAFTKVEPSKIIIVDGAYACSPHLCDLLDCTLLVHVPVAERHRRLARRENPEFLTQWHRLWDDFERFYFSEIRPAECYHLIIEN